MVSNLGLWPASHVVAGTRVSSTVRRVLMDCLGVDTDHLPGEVAAPLRPAGRQEKKWV